MRQPDRTARRAAYGARLTWLLAAVALSALAAPRAAAQREAEARASFDAGRAAWERGAYARAVERYRESYALSPHPQMLVNIGNAWRRLGRVAPAADAYRRFLETAPPDAAERAEVRQLLRQLDVTPAAPARFDPIGGRVLTWIALGVGVAAAAVSLGLWLDLESRYGAMAAGCGQSAAGCAESAIDGLVATRDASIGVGVAAGLASVTAVVSWVLEGLP